jgi:3-hydroxymyristoyl/3-hydroxydecanoyl-(acyl carrier protein) dehydratase
VPFNLPFFNDHIPFFARFLMPVVCFSKKIITTLETIGCTIFVFVQRRKIASAKVRYCRGKISATFRTTKIGKRGRPACAG